MNNHASDAARFLNERINFTTRDHAWIDVTPDPQGSTAHLEQLSDTLYAEGLRDRLKRRPLVKHPDRSRGPFQVWVREVSDRGHSLLPDPGREELDGAA